MGNLLFFLFLFGMPLLVVVLYLLTQVGTWPSRSTPDLHTQALPQLSALDVDNPRLAALLAEVERGRDRREGRT